MNVNFGATLDPYTLDENNNRIDEFQINSGGGLFRLTSANLTLIMPLAVIVQKKSLIEIRHQLMNQFETEVEMMIYLEELWIPQQKNFQDDDEKKKALITI